MARGNYVGTEMAWGMCEDKELPKLPEGWRYQREKGHWVMAISPEGKSYYVGATKLYPQRRRKETGTFFVDTQKGVIELKQHGTTQQQN